MDSIVRFRYSLQKVVDVKTTEKTRAEWMLSEAIGRLQVEERTLQELLDEKHSVHERLIEMSSKPTLISDLLSMQDYLESLEQQLFMKMKDVSKARFHVEECQHGLSAKLLEEKVWTNAKDKAYRQFVAGVQKKEQDELDEMALMRYFDSQAAHG